MKEHGYAWKCKDPRNDGERLKVPFVNNLIDGKAKYHQNYPEHWEYTSIHFSVSLLTKETYISP